MDYVSVLSALNVGFKCRTYLAVSPKDEQKMFARITAWVQERRYNRVVQEEEDAKPVDRFNKGALSTFDANAISLSVIDALSEDSAIVGYTPSLESLREIHKHPWISIQDASGEHVAHQVEVSVQLNPDAFHADYPNAKPIVRPVRLNLEVR